MSLNPYKKLYQSAGETITDEEAREAQSNLAGFFELLIEADREQGKVDDDG